MSPEKMVYMANQIATFFSLRTEEEAVSEIAAHISDFWEPRMRRRLLDHMAQGGAGLNPLVLKAQGAIRVPKETA